MNYYTKTSDFSLTLGKRDSIVYHQKNHEGDSKVTLVDTGEQSQTAARIHKIHEHLKDTDCFVVTYGDGVADINIGDLLKTYKKSGLLAMISGVQPSGRFGQIESHNGVITEFNEKPNVSTGLINGGFMVFNRDIFKKYFDSKQDQFFESDILSKMVKDKKVGVYQHHGFWQCVDTPIL